VLLLYKIQKKKTQEKLTIDHLRIEWQWKAVPSAAMCVKAFYVYVILSNH